MVTEYGRCPAFGYECEYVSMVEAQAAEIERLIKASDGDVGLMHWQVEKIESLEAEIERLRGLLAEAVEYPASDHLDNGVLNRIYAALERKAEQ
jgi:hypothetical protein